MKASQISASHVNSDRIAHTNGPWRIPVRDNLYDALQQSLVQAWEDAATAAGEAAPTRFPPTMTTAPANVLFHGDTELRKERLIAMLANVLEELDEIEGKCPHTGSKNNSPRM